jgi:hypothetical protein
MAKLALFVRLDAKTGKEREVEALLHSAQALVSGDCGIRAWFALEMAPQMYGIFDTFDNESDREAYLAGPVADILTRKASELLSRPPVVEKVQVLTSLERNTREVPAAPPSVNYSSPPEAQISQPAPEVPKVGSRDAPGG